MKLPTSIINKIESEAAGLSHGIITVSIHIRDKKLSRYVLIKEESFLTSDVQEVKV